MKTEDSLPYFENNTLDSFVRDCFKKNKSSSISFWLIASYAYYCRYESLLSDTTFDKLSKWLLDNMDSLGHINKELITKDMLVAGSGYNLKEEDYPLRVRLVAQDLISQFYRERS